MTSASQIPDPSVNPALSRLVAIVGVGHTDYGADFRTAKRRDAGPAATDLELAQRAFERAIRDAGIDRDAVDGLNVSIMYERSEVMAPVVADVLGIVPRFVLHGGGMMVNVIPASVAALAAGDCDVMALVYSATSRSQRRLFGGATFLGDGRDSYYYYHPWGWSSQAAHWALMCQSYMARYGATEEDLASVAITLRSYAVVNGAAIMRTPLTLDDYLIARHIVRPLRLLDLCLVNDGAVCLILQRADEARSGMHDPVLVAGWGTAEVPYTKMDFMVEQRLEPQLRDASDQALKMAGLAVSDIDHFQAYDASSIHLVNQLEGCGFVKPGEGLEFCAAGGIGTGGALPTNTSGGMLSEAYMHGWSQVVEAVRQLRHEAGDRQVAGVRHSLYSVATTESAHPLVFSREG